MISEMKDMEYRHICLLSGGKDSTALALYLKDKYPDIDCEYVFCDTHKELPEIYTYLTRVEAYLGKEVIRLCSEEYGRGFDHYLKIYGGFLPSPSMRWCTKNLKIKPLEDYIGEDRAKMYIGIRADEHRDGYISTKENIKPVFPFKTDGIKKNDVFRILEESGVGIPKYYSWRSRSGCYFCFFQRKGEWIRLKEKHPELFELAKKYEKPDEGFTWCEDESLKEMERPSRIKEIKRQEEARSIRLKKKQKPSTLAQAFGYQALEDPDEPLGCIVCHI